ncbi:MAG: hypothetical protein ABSG98_06045 [Anaerolineales bacterium]|jgi:hypothetical protein
MVRRSGALTFAEGASEKFREVPEEVDALLGCNCCREGIGGNWAANEDAELA